MKIKINYIRFATIAAALFCLGLASCRDDFGRYGGANGEKIKVTVPDFKMGEGFEGLQTRTSVDLSNKKYITTWTEGDYIDVFALGAGKFEGTAASNSHVKFQITDIAEGNEAHARFLGDGYGLLEGYGYAAYYPYKGGSDYSSDAVELSYDYSGTTITPDATNHIADFDYLVATPQIPEDQTVTLDFNHVGTLVRLRVYCPNAGTYNRIILETEGEDAFVKKATLNVADGSTTITETTDVMEFPITPTEVSENGTVTIYFMIHPNNYKSKLLNVYIIGDDNSWNGTVVGKDFAKGNAESLNVVANKEGGVIKNNGHDYVDLGLPSGTLWATMNLGATEVVGTEINPVTGALDYYGQHYCFGETNGFNEPPTAYPADWTGQKNDNFMSLSTKTSANMQSPVYYMWGNKEAYDSRNLWKYNEVLDELELDDDAAHVNWGGDWRTPSYEDLIELKNNCVFLYVTSYQGVSANGFVVYLSKDERDKGRACAYGQQYGSYTDDDPHIFMPYGGGYSGTFTYSTSFWMSRTIGAFATAYAFNINGQNVGTSNPPVFYGMPIRPVMYSAEKKKTDLSSNNHKYVDLGLSVKWATCNVGAERPEEYGDYFAWGATKSQDVYDWVHAPYQTQNVATSSEYDDTKWLKYIGTNPYNQSYIDENAKVEDAIKTVLDPEDDAAHVNWGGKWRMPTSEEINELETGCYWQLVTSYNGKSVKGFVVYKAKIESDKGKDSKRYPSRASSYSLSDPHIFLPLPGAFNGENANAANTDVYGFYYSSSLSGAAYNAQMMFLSIYDYAGGGGYPRYLGFSVRAVLP